MKSKLGDKPQRVLTAIKLDAQTVFSRIKHRKLEYMEVFSARRNRDHFPEIFENKYSQIDIQTIIEVSPDVQVAVDAFFNVVDDIRWYVMTTQDMPGTVSEKVEKKIHVLEEKYELMNLYINAELGIEEKPKQLAESSQESFSSEASEDEFSSNSSDFDDAPEFGSDSSFEDVDPIDEIPTIDLD